MRAEMFWPTYLIIFFGLFMWGLASDHKAHKECVSYAMDATKFTSEQIKELCK